VPELPEVEFAARSLRKWMRSGVVVHAAFAATRLVRPAKSGRALEAALSGKKVVDVDRRGKWLRIRFAGADADETRLFSHLGMTGKWVRRGVDDPAERWERARLSTSNGAARRRASATSTRACSGG
jgi:formamidopyrimidine-DNA glycosylase